MEHKRKEQREWAWQWEHVRVVGRWKYLRNGCLASSLGPRQKRPLSLCYHIPRLPSLGPQVLSLWTRKANHKKNKSPHVFQEILVMKGWISGWSMREEKKGNKEMERQKKNTPDPCVSWKMLFPHPSPLRHSYMCSRNNLHTSCRSQGWQKRLSSK